MKKRSEHIIGEGTIVRFLNGVLSQTEKEEFDSWLNEDPGNQKTFEETKKIWEHSVNISDFQSIDTKGDWAKVQERIKFKGSKPIRTSPIKRSLILFWRVAAVLILFMGIGFLVKQYLFTSPEIISVTTGDFKDEITLPDGSTVFLNKYSELKYPEKFNRNRRQVDLDGEGYFEVTKDPDKSFRIEVGTQAIVEVLGTSFNLRSDKEEGLVNVSVVTGRVAFFKPESDSNKTILIKDEAATLNNGIISKDNLKNSNFLSWKTGILSFENESFEIVMKELTKYYNKKFSFKNTDGKGIRFTSRFDNQDLESLLEEIKLVLNLEYSITGDSVIFNKTR